MSVKCSTLNVCTSLEGEKTPKSNLLELSKAVYAVLEEFNDKTQIVYSSSSLVEKSYRAVTYFEYRGHFMRLHFKKPKTISLEEFQQEFSREFKNTLNNIDSEIQIKRISGGNFNER